MPYSKISIGKGRYKVINSKTGKVHAKNTSSKDADAQIRIMEQAEGKGKKKR